MEIRNLSGQILFEIRLDSICDKYGPTIGLLKIADTTRIVLECFPAIYVMNDKVEILKKESITPRRRFEQKPEGAIEVYLQDGTYYFTKEGKLLGQKGLAGFSDDVGDITQIRETVGSVIDTWARIFCSPDLKHVVGLLNDYKTIQYFSLDNK